MDHRLEPQRRVDDELTKRLRGSVVILSLISPRYFEPEWCRKEMDTFVTEVGGGVSTDRIFMVEVLPTERENWHAAVRDLSPVKLWQSGLTNPEPKTLGWPVPNVRADREYLAPTMASGQNPAEFRQQFDAQLKSSHGVIVIYGTAPPNWVQAKYGDVRKVLALHRKGTWAGLMVAPPDPKAPHGLPLRSLMVLDCKQVVGVPGLAVQGFADGVLQVQRRACGCAAAGLDAQVRDGQDLGRWRGEEKVAKGRMQCRSQGPCRDAAHRGLRDQVPGLRSLLLCR
jgi:hypothetical protein